MSTRINPTYARGAANANGLAPHMHALGTMLIEQGGERPEPFPSVFELREAPLKATDFKFASV